jgi:limonene-1,2-epoxide hydrolase
MKRTNIEFMIGWLDALRRDDRDALRAPLDAQIVWQGLPPEWVCHGPDEVVDMFAGRRDDLGEIETIELIGADTHAILHPRGGDIARVEDIALPDGIYNVFALQAGTVMRIDDFADRNQALSAAGVMRAQRRSGR